MEMEKPEREEEILEVDILPAKEVLSRFDTLSGDIRYMTDTLRKGKEKKKSIIEYGGKQYEIVSNRAKNLGMERDSLFDKLTLPYLRGEDIEINNFTELFYIVHSLHKVGYQLGRKELENLVHDCPDFEKVLAKASRRIKRKAGKKMVTLRYLIKHPLAIVPSNTSQEQFKNNAIIHAFAEIQKDIIKKGIPTTVDAIASVILRKDVGKLIEMTLKLGVPIAFNLIFRCV